ncbi:transposase [Lasius niger]|uniref:Transposase n=1 Tax=Lasius niger TaxID=67767 RepID=A0A0J7KJ25_LASNI|nr:transposase [Lasius niger]
MRRRQFIEAVALDLVKPHVRTRRSSLTHVRKDLKDLMDKFLGYGPNDDISHSDSSGPSQPKKAKVRRCHLCPRNLDRKSRQECSECKQTVCKIHSVDKKICQSCDKET